MTTTTCKVTRSNTTINIRVMAHVFFLGLGVDNLGTLAVLDYFYGTNKHFLSSYQCTVDHGYSSPDYPVDKLLGRTTAGLTNPVQRQARL